jgi:hypothetical protein
LKNKYGSGFELTVKLKGINIERETEELTKYVTSLFDSAMILSSNGGLVTYQIPKEEMKMSVAFTNLYEEKETLSIEEFTVAQPTLEQVRLILLRVFLSFIPFSCFPFAMSLFWPFHSFLGFLFLRFYPVLLFVVL